MLAMKPLWMKRNEKNEPNPFDPNNWHRVVLKAINKLVCMVHDHLNSFVLIGWNHC